VGEIYDVAFAYANPQAHLSSFRQFLAPFTLLTLNDPIMERFAEIRSYLRRRGELISDFDILIGATALHHDLTLLTYNTRHFKRIPDLKLYPPAAWHPSLSEIINCTNLTRSQWPIYDSLVPSFIPI